MAINGDLKIIFFISNSLTWLVPGIMFFSLGVGLEVLTSKHSENVPHICCGLGMMFMATQGYVGAITGNKKTLNGYMSMSTMLPIAAIVLLAMTCEAKPGISNAMLAQYSLGYMLMISYTVIILINFLLGAVVAGLARQDETVALNMAPGLKA